MDRLDVLDSRYDTRSADSDGASYHDPGTTWTRTVDDVRQTASNQAASNKAHADPASQAPQTTSGAPTTTHTVKPGETLTELAARYGLKVHDLAAANPSVQNPNLLHVGQTLSVPLDKTGGKLPGLHAVLPGETLGQIADRYHSSVSQIAAANNITDPDRITAGDHIWIPAAGTNTGSTTKPDATKPGTNTPTTTKPGATTPTTSKPGTANPATPPPDTKAQVQAIVSAAQAQSDPNKALKVLDTGYAHASQPVKDAVLADPNAGKILDAVARQANQPLTQKPANGILPEGQALQALNRLSQATQGLDKGLAGAVVDRAAPAYQAFQKNPANGGMPVLGMQGMTELMNLSGRIAGTPQGDDAIKRFATTGAWNTDAVVNSIGAGADPAYAIEVARQIKASGQDPSIVVQAIDNGVATGDQTKIAQGASPAATLDIAHRMQAAGLDASGVMKAATDGTQQFKDKVKSDVGKLAKQDSELAWLVQNDGAGMTPQQLNNAVDSYRIQKGPAWQKQETALRQQVADDGSKLTQQMIALNQAAPQIKGAQQTVDSTLKTIANDPSAGLAISTAIQSDPNLAEPGKAANVADIFTLSKVGDIGRKFTNEMGAAFVRRNVLSKLQGIDLNDPASVAQVKQAIHSMDSEGFARLIGVSPNDTKKAVAALDTAVDRVAAHPDQADAALQDLGTTLNRDASLTKAFNKTTVPGQLLRGVAVGFAGASLINSYGKFRANPSDPQNDIKLLTDSAGFAQKNSELLVGLGAVDKQSAIGQFGGEWKLAGRATAGDLLTGISAVLDGVSAVRSGFGIGTQQDTGNAIFSATSSVGGLMAVAPAFGAAAWLGPVGLGVAAVGVVGNTIYNDVKDAHQYEGASASFLKAAGYDGAAAQALSKQDGVISGASGAAQMPFLAKYAEMKHLNPTQLQNWVNSLTPDQVQHLSERLLQTAGDAHGEASQFTNGPPQTAIISGGSPYPAIIILTNTLGEFEKNLAYDHVPHP
jgi:LysM repeat protein